MKRFFSKRQKIHLKIISGKLCNFCKKSLVNNFNADHIKPFSKKGKTILNNGQSLCRDCNLKKGSHYA